MRISKSGKDHFIVNGKDAKEYFKTEDQRRLILDPIIKGIQAGGAKSDIKWSVEVHVSGGGVHSQAEAIRHGLSRALVLSDGTLRGSLKTLGYLKRDPGQKNAENSD